MECKARHIDCMPSLASDCKSWCGRRKAHGDELGDAHTKKGIDSRSARKWTLLFDETAAYQVKELARLCDAAPLRECADKCEGGRLLEHGSNRKEQRAGLHLNRHRCSQYFGVLQSMDKIASALHFHRNGIQQLLFALYSQ
jgi:hypothetical protein